MADEQWRPVVGYEGRYEVSSEGRVRSIGRTFTYTRKLNDGRVDKVVKTTVDKMLTPSKGSNGYYTVRLCGKTFALHSVVLTAFIGPKPEGYAGCHGDRDRSNNRLSNLRWDTYASNYADIVRHGTLGMTRGAAGRWVAVTQEPKMADLLTLIRVVDVESTGIDDPAEIVEVGWTDVRLFPEGWVIESGPHSRLVSPGIPISYPAMAVHHISEAEAATGINPDEARALVAQGADLLCAHNAAFDGRFIRGHKAPWLCTFKCARTAWPDLQSHGNGSIRYERGLCLGDPRTEPSHRAGPDTWVTAAILLDLLKVLSIDEMLEITRNPVLLRKIDFGEHAGKTFPEIPWDYLNSIVNKSNMPQDPKREDVVHTARIELAKRANGSAPDQQKATPAVDPDAWRNEMGRV
jgi:exodeoxyribonuclease X